MSFSGNLSLKAFASFSVPSMFLGCIGSPPKIDNPEIRFKGIDLLTESYFKQNVALSLIDIPEFTQAILDKFENPSIKAALAMEIKNPDNRLKALSFCDNMNYKITVAESFSEKEAMIAALNAYDDPEYLNAVARSFTKRSPDFATTALSYVNDKYQFIDAYIVNPSEKWKALNDFLTSSQDKERMIDTLPADFLLGIDLNEVDANLVAHTRMKKNQISLLSKKCLKV